MENPDLRKASLDAVRSIKGEIKGAVVILTDCDKSTVFVGGETNVLINMLAGAMLQDANILALFHAATLEAVAKMEKK